ncbi:glycoside hydrolase domain-containing protein [Zunongwangia sp.]|uniref:glycoside hydrolase domain-containing protein n=1 Tax=Zunongwangia sp. TaxID=1965325 RepID=UPI003AA80672
MTNISNKSYLILWVVIFFFSCSKEDDDTTQIPPTNQHNEKLQLYPNPPSGWKGETNPYETTGWVGDVMPYFEDGKFHIFFLHDAQTKPVGKGFHDIHKFVSKNLTDFDYQGRMINYGKTADPDFAIGTGSVININGTYYFYYTGHNGNTEYIQDHPRESILLAKSNDLKNWKKTNDFLLTAPEGYYDFEFRDPYVFYNSEEQEYWMLVSAQTDQRKAAILLFTSTDPVNKEWEVKDPLYTSSLAENYLMMECADIFKMGNYWYLLFSENWNKKVTHYRIASTSKGPWVTPKNDLLDGEFFYAGKTAANENGRFLFGWTARRFPENNTGNKEWAGNLVTHELIQKDDGGLGVKPPSSILNIFKNNQTLQAINTVGNISQNENNFELDATKNPAYITYPFSQLPARITTNITIKGDNGKTGFIFNIENDIENSSKIVFDSSKNRIVCVVNGEEKNSIPFHLETGKDYSIEIILEESICIVYINNEKAFSNRIYGLGKENWGIFADEINTNFKNLKLNTN